VFYPNAARSQAALQPVPRWVERLSRHVRCPYGQRPGRPEVLVPLSRKCPAGRRESAVSCRTHWTRGFTAPERTGSGVPWCSDAFGAPGSWGGWCRRDL